MYPNLKLQLWRSGIRQNRLAQLLGMDETMLSRVVNGYREPNEKLRLAIANILRCEEGWLFEATTPSENAQSHETGLTAAPLAPKAST